MYSLNWELDTTWLEHQVRKVSALRVIIHTPWMLSFGFISHLIAGVFIFISYFSYSFHCITVGSLFIWCFMYNDILLHNILHHILYGKSLVYDTNHEIFLQQETLYDTMTLFLSSPRLWQSHKGILIFSPSPIQVHLHILLVIQGHYVSLDIILVFRTNLCAGCPNDNLKLVLLLDEPIWMLDLIHTHTQIYIYLFFTPPIYLQCVYTKPFMLNIFFSLDANQIYHKLLYICHMFHN